MKGAAYFRAFESRSRDIALVLLMACISILSSALPAQAQTAAWPNEPAGSTLINDWGWDSCPGGGWQPANGCGFTRSDPTAPVSPLSVMRWEYNPSTGYGGGDPYIVLGYNELYVGYWFKLSDPFEGTGNGMHKLSFSFMGTHGLWLKAVGAQGSNDFVIQFHLQGVDPSIDNCHIPGGWGECFNRAWFGPTRISLGTWHLLEFYIKRSSSVTGKDGIARVWLDNSLQINITTLNTPASPVQDISFTPTWTPPVDRTNPDMISFDHVHVSAPNCPDGCPVTGNTATAPQACDTYEIYEFPPDCTPSTGTFSPDGDYGPHWTLSKQELDNLTVSCKPGFCGTIDFIIVPKQAW